MNRFKKIGKIVLFAAIGSASWEFLIKGTLVKVADKIVIFISRFSSGIKDFPFDNPQDIDTIFVAFPILIFVLGFGYYVGYNGMNLYIDAKKILLRESYSMDRNSGDTFDSKIDSKVDLEVRKRILKKLNLDTSKIVRGAKYVPVVFFVLMSFIAITFIIGFSLIIIKYSIKRSTEANLQIVRPYIDPHDYLILNSKYYQLNGINSYKELMAEMEGIAKKRNLSLKKLNE